MEHYESELEREYEEVELYPDLEKQEVRDLFSYYGLGEEQQNAVVEELSKDKKKWVDFMMKFELGLEKPGKFDYIHSILIIIIISSVYQTHQTLLFLLISFIHIASFIYFFIIFCSLIQFNSIQFNSIQFNSIQMG